MRIARMRNLNFQKLSLLCHNLPPVATGQIMPNAAPGGRLERYGHNGLALFGRVSGKPASRSN
jgi:hypothetical protein